jgi:hypothetical protein
MKAFLAEIALFKSLIQTGRRAVLTGAALTMTIIVEQFYVKRIGLSKLILQIKL